MRLQLAALTMSAVMAAALTPLVRRSALRLGAVSRPGGRNIHGQVVPRLGGVGIYAALLGPAVLLYLGWPEVRSIVDEHGLPALAIVGGGTLMCGVGLWDDVRRLRPAYKLLAQTIAATAAYACGLRIDAVAVPFGPTLHMGAFALPMTLLWVVGIVNAINLIDGLDGLAAGIVLFASITNLVVAHFTHAAYIGLVMSLMIGALVGFLLFNFNPARIFMGDSGSYLLGYVLATTVLVGSTQKTSTAVSLLVPCLALGVPIFDTLFTIVRRFLERRPIFSPDRGHIHHRLIDMGLTHRRAVLLLYGVSLALCVAGIVTSVGQSWHAGVAIALASVALAALIRSAGYLRDLQLRLTGRSRLRSPAFEAMRAAFAPTLEHLMRARSEQQILEALGLHLGVVARIELTRVGASTPTHAWAGPRNVSDAELLCACFPVGTPAAARANLVVSWHSEREDIPAEIDILLQLLADLVGHRLEVITSPLAPQPPARAPRGMTELSPVVLPRIAP
jgi:UDP-GlcNAc:undecaprenyl-phosphate GlcNAc-1-phosphate transferase